MSKKLNIVSILKIVLIIITITILNIWFIFKIKYNWIDKYNYLYCMFGYAFSIGIVQLILIFFLLDILSKKGIIFLDKQFDRLLIGYLMLMGLSAIFSSIGIIYKGKINLFYLLVGIILIISSFIILTNKDKKFIVSFYSILLLSIFFIYLTFVSIKLNNKDFIVILPFFFINSIFIILNFKNWRESLQMDS